MMHTKIFGRSRRVTAWLLCLCMVVSLFSGSGLFAGVAYAEKVDERNGGVDGPLDYGEATPFDSEKEGQEGDSGTAQRENDQIALMALSSASATLTDSGSSDKVELGEGVVDWPYTHVKELEVAADFAGTGGGYVKVTIAPGLKIDRYRTDGFRSVEKATPSDADLNHWEIPKYPKENVKWGTLLYQVNDTASEIYLDITLSVDTLLWSKTGDWEIENAIVIDFLNTEKESTGTSINGTVNIQRNDPGVTSPSWNQLYTSDNNETVPAAVDTPFKLKTFQIVSNLHGSPLGAYYKTLTFTMPIPHSGETYAQHVGNQLACNVTTPTISEDPDAHTVTYTWTDLYVPAGVNIQITPYFQWTSAQVAGQTATVNRNEFTVKADFYGVENWDFPLSTTITETYQILDDALFTLESGSQRVFNAGYGPDKVYNVGQFFIRNIGVATSREQTLTFTYPSNDYVGVIAQYIPVPLHQQLKSLTYKTSINSEERSYDFGTIEYANEGNYRCFQFTADMAELELDEYFTEIKAVVSGYPAGYSNYNSSAKLSPNNAGIVMGVLKSAETGNFESTLTLSPGPGKGNSESLSTTLSTSIVNDEQTTQMTVTGTYDGGSPFDQNPLQLSKQGEHKVHFSSYIQTTNYPYTNNLFVNNPVIYVRLPETITLGELKLTSCQYDIAGKLIVDSEREINNSDYDFINSDPDFSGDGFHVYTITLKNNAGALGYFNRKLGDTRLKLEFDMVVGIETKDMILDMRDCIYVAYSSDQAINPDGSLTANQVKDLHDVNNNSIKEEEYFSTFSSAATNSLEIEAARVGLVFNSYAKLGSDGNGDESNNYNYKNHKLPKNDSEGMVADGHTMYLTEDEDTIHFRFTAENNSGGDITIKESELGKEEFFYYIPVPKMDDFWDNENKHIQDEPFKLNLNLMMPYGQTEPVKVDGDPDDKFEVRYSTSVISSMPSGNDLYYNNRDTISANYKTWTEFTNSLDGWESLDSAAKQEELNKIKMIRISVKNSSEDITIPADTKVTFDITYSFHQRTDELVGYAIEFGPCGSTLYNLNGRPSTDHAPTQRIRAEIQTGRIAGRVFIDEDYDGKFSDGDSLLRYPETGSGGTFYIEKAGSTDGYNDLRQDDGEPAADFNLEISAEHTPDSGEEEPDEIHHNAQGATFVTNGRPNAYDNTYAITGLRAVPYSVTVNNPKYTAGSVGEDSLRFIPLTAESTGTRSVNGSAKSAGASSYSIIGTGYQSQAVFPIRIVSSAESVENNRMMDIGLQRPHKVTFKVEYQNDYGSAPDPPADQAIYVWHGTTISASGGTVPDFTLDSDFQWEGDAGPVWKNGDSVLDSSATAIAADVTEVTYTAAAVRIPHNVSYDLNGGSGTTPASQSAVNGQSVTLQSYSSGEAARPTHAQEDGKDVVFIGWSTANQLILDRNNSTQAFNDICDSSVTMRDSDITVYAVWGYDANHNGTADVLEPRYSLTYDANGGTNPPAPETNQIEGDSVTLAEGTGMTAPSGTGEHVGHTVIFVGWSDDTAVRGRIYSKDDHGDAAATDALILPKDLPYTMPARNVTIYAVWAYDENRNNTPDYREEMHSLNYDANGGIFPADVPAFEQYLPGVEVTLKKPGDTWKRATDNAVFVGWSESQRSEAMTFAPGSGVLMDSVTMPDGDMRVYAVWAVNKNNNDEPDYQEAKVTVTLDPNGGYDGSSPAERKELADQLPGDSCELPTYEDCKWTENGSDEYGETETLVFAGWSDSRLGGYISQTGIYVGPEADKNGKRYNEIAEEFHYTVPGEDIILYAVYAEDQNEDMIPDFSETSLQVEYYANEGTLLPGREWVRGTVGLFYRCYHHHVAGEKEHHLLSVDLGKRYVARSGAVLMGWSSVPHGVLKTEAEVNEALTEEVILPVSGNARVYAVWAEDRNMNGNPDYRDAKYAHTYYRNSALTEWRPSSSGLDPAGVTERLPVGVTRIVYGNGGALPAAQTDILSDTMITLADPVLGERTDYDAEGNEVHHYVQLGWSGFCHSASSSDEMAGRWLHTDEDPGTAGIQRKIVSEIFQFSFAVWALDDNHNGIPDYDEEPSGSGGSGGTGGSGGYSGSGSTGSSGGSGGAGGPGGPGVSDGPGSSVEIENSEGIGNSNGPDSPLTVLVAPDTGDDHHWGIWAAVLLLSLAAMLFFGISIFTKRSQNGQGDRREDSD